MGGTSSEREVSLTSGRNVAEALASLGTYEVVPIDLTEDNLNALPKDTDAVYIALHGGWGENGGVQTALNAAQIPYTGPGAEASRLAMDKLETKKVLDLKKVQTAPWRRATPADAPASSPFGYPVIVKAPREGSSVGVYKCDTDAAFRKAISDASKIDAEKFGGPGEALIETFIPGREMTVGIIAGETLPAIEIVAAGGWYGYEEKYNSSETAYPFLADSANPTDAALERKLQALALDAYHALGCRGVTRVDFRVTPEGEAYVLELNTSPGFTSHSLVPKAGIRTGLSFARVCEKILTSAACDR